MDDCRKAFEAWISAPPLKKGIERWPDDPEEYAWPGNYVELDVQLAWLAWKAATRHSKKTMCNQN